MFDYAWLLLAFPAAGLLINLFFGRWFSRRIIGFIATGAVAAAFVTTVLLFLNLSGLPTEERLVSVQLWEWITIGSFRVDAELLIDPLSLTMALVVTGVGMLIHLYSISYMEEDERFTRFFIYLNFFIFAMLLLVLSSSFLGLFVGWEGVGLASFLLIGFWFDRRDDTYGFYADAGKKAFLVNRVGDAGVVLAMILIWHTLGTLNLMEVNALAHSELTIGAANLIGLLLLLGVAGKSAQIPLYVWLPDAMAGPTPVSALIHAATMVTAGVYLIVRTFVIWEVAVDASLAAAWIGGLTALLGATIALVQTDMKKILAYSTVSQLGYMVMAAGAGAYGAAIFHLTTHAFFKALLFLGAGSVMHALHGELDIRRMGGLRRKLPSTYVTFVIGAAALAGLPLISGFFSKDAILVGTGTQLLPLTLLGLFTALLTAFYSFRMVFLIFFGKPRNRHLFDHAHESPLLMTIPLWILAFFSLFGGLLNLPFVETMNQWMEPLLGHVEHPSLALELAIITASVFVSLFGLLMAYSRYLTKESWVERLAESVRFMQPVIEHKYYVDEFYNAVIVNPLRRLAGWLAAVFDPKLIDGAVNGIGGLSLNWGERVRMLQNGLIPTYALSLFIGVVVLVLYYVFLA